MEVGIRDLRNHLSRYLDQVREGDELVITDRGTAVARVIPIDSQRALDRLIDDGVVTPASSAIRTRPKTRISSNDTVSDLIAAQRR